MIKRILVATVLGISGLAAAAPSADAGVFVRRVAPVRRVAARAVLPPYPVARAVVARPLYRPVVSYGVGYYGPAVYSPPVVYGAGVYVW